MGCCGCSPGMALPGIPGYSAPPPPSQGISGPLVPTLDVGLAIPRVGEEGAVMEPCPDAAKNWWWLWLLLGVVVGMSLRKKR